MPAGRPDMLSLEREIKMNKNKKVEFFSSPPKKGIYIYIRTGDDMHNARRKHIIAQKHGAPVKRIPLPICSHYIDKKDLFFSIRNKDPKEKRSKIAFPLTNGGDIVGSTHAKLITPSRLGHLQIIQIR